jgi:pimeloyl-ACP methyl ester carboxylesterase
VLKRSYVFLQSVFRHLVLGLFSAALLLASTACGSRQVDAKLPQLSAATGAALSGTCEDLAGRLSTLANTRITASRSVTAGTLKIAGQDVPEHCLVEGKMFERVSPVDGLPYAIGFEMRLPVNWNGRFFYQANGGIDGYVLTATGSFGGGPLTHALLQGFAVLSSDAGHPGEREAGFGIDPQARLDYGYQAVGKVTPMAKNIIQAAYGKKPDRSYIGGCSNGGRHTLVAAARYADQYDGFLAGAPGLNLPKAAVASIFGAQRYAKVATDPNDLSTAFTASERTTVANAVLAKCDALDGAADGLIQDFKACQAVFSLAGDVPTCAGARDGTCLSAAQKTAIAAIFSGATTSKGASVYASFPYDSGLGAYAFGAWEFTAPLILDSWAVGMIFKVPPENPTGFNGRAFSLAANIDDLMVGINARNDTYTESAMSFMTPPHPTELSALKKRGAKIMVYHGVSDAIFSVNDTMNWYEGLRSANGGDASNFVRFFPIPGMGHCSEGPATDQFDMITPLVQWVEKGQAPDSVIAKARGKGNVGGVNDEVPASWSPGRTRPLCPYPKVARYKGGSLEVAESFSCQ